MTALVLGAGILVTAPSQEAGAADAPLYFADGFESGTFGAWTTSSGLVASQALVADGAWAARATMTGGAAYAQKTLATAQPEVTVSARLSVQSIGGTSAVNFLKLRTATGTAIAEAYLTPAGVLGVRNDVTGVATNTAVVVPAGGWHTVSLHVAILSTGSTLELSYDGMVVAAVAGTATLGSAPVGRVQVGENVAGRTADLAYDTVTVTGPQPPPPPPPPVLFSDGFESGTLGAWTSSTGLTVQSAVVADGTWAARATMSGTAGQAQKTLASPVAELTLSGRVDLLTIGGTSAVNFLKLRTPTGTAIAEVYVTPTRVLGVRNDVTGVATPSTATLAAGWHDVALRVVVAGALSTVEVSVDGTPVPGLTLTTDLGSALVGRIQVGENVAGRTADVVYDSIRVLGAVPGADPVLAAAGDIACDPANPAFNGGSGTSNACQQRAVSDAILADPSITAVAALGDVQYECGGASAFAASYDPSWGRFKAKTKPAVGNHEYLPSGTNATDCDPTGTAAGYFSYFGASAGTPGQGYYSYDLGTWHVVVLNTTCGSAGGCGPTSPQTTWLRADLAAHPAACTLAYFHIPTWSSGGRAATNANAFNQALFDAGAEVVLTGHDHIYERFAPQDPAGIPTPTGLRAWVVGTGGANHTAIAAVAPNSEVRDTTSYGVLKLTLHPGSYDWQFVPVGGTFTDAGTGACH